jgi:hypothetical protein
LHSALLFAIFAPKTQNESNMRKGKKAKQGEEGAQDKPQPERKKNWKEYTATVEDIQNFIMDRMVQRSEEEIKCRQHMAVAHTGTVGTVGTEYF